MRVVLLSLAFGLSCSAIASAADAIAAAPTYKIVKSVPLGAPDRWDYVVYDGASHRVYVAHGDRLSVVDSASGTVVGTVEGIPGGTHGTGIVTALNKGYTDDGKAGTAVEFDLKTLKIIKSIPAQDDADGIGFDSPSGHIFVVDGDSEKVTVLDPKTDTVIANVDGGGGLEAGVSGGNGKFYVDGAEKNEIVRIDTATNKADAHWPMKTCKRPSGIAFDAQGHRLFASCGNGIMSVLNTDTGAVVAELPIAQGSDGAAFDPKRKLAFSSSAQGKISVIQEKDPEHFVALPDIPSQVTGRTMGIDPESGRLFVAAADIDPNAKVPPGRNGGPGRPQPLPGTLKLLFIDPQP